MEIRYTGNILVKLKADGSLTALRSAPPTLSGTYRLPLQGEGQWLELSADGGCTAALSEEEFAVRGGFIDTARLLTSPDVAWAEPETVLIEPTLPPRSAGLERAPPQYNDAHLDRINARDTGFDGRGVKVAHIDTGLAYPMIRTLLENIVEDEARDFSRGTIPGRPGARDRLSGGARPLAHGTLTATLLAGRGSVPDPLGVRRDYVGIAPGVHLLPIRIGDSVVQVFNLRVARGIEYAARKGAQVACICIGGLPSQRLIDAIALATERGMVIAAAAGNHFRVFDLPVTPSFVVHPAAEEPVLAVGGQTRDGGRYLLENPEGGRSSANYGPQMDLCGVAPDTWWVEPEIVGSQSLEGRLSSGAGTSNATPQVAGAIAQWLEKHGDALPAPGPQRIQLIRHALISSARPITDPDDQPYFGAGLLDVKAALESPPDDRSLESAAQEPAAPPSLEERVLGFAGVCHRSDLSEVETVYALRDYWQALRR